MTTILPETSVGKWSIWLILVFLVLFIIAQIIAAVGRDRGAFETEDLNNTYITSILRVIIPAGISGIAAFILGLVSIVKFEERSWLVYSSIILGFLVLSFVFGEFLFEY